MRQTAVVDKPSRYKYGGSRQDANKDARAQPSGFHRCAPLHQLVNDDRRECRSYRAAQRIENTYDPPQLRSLFVIVCQFRTPCGVRNEENRIGRPECDEHENIVDHLDHLRRVNAQEDQTAEYRQRKRGRQHERLPSSHRRVQFVRNVSDDRTADYIPHSADGHNGPGDRRVDSRHGREKEQGKHAHHTIQSGVADSGDSVKHLCFSA